MPTAPQTSNGSRLAFLDWMRGSAALIMLQGHVTHSFMSANLREQSPYVLSQFIGGITPAVFLFLTGVTLAFLMDSRWRAGITPGRRVTAALRRAGYLALLAIAFRIQLWAFAGGQSGWENLFKVDILNCMAFAIVVMSPLAVFDTRDRVRWAGGVGLAIALLSPVISTLDWTWVHPFARNYFVPDTNFFTFFPWGAFLAFGVAAGSILRLVKHEDLNRLMQWGVLLGLALIWSAQYFSNLPYSLYTNADFWLNSPALIFIKTGVLLLMMAFAFLWTRYAVPVGWSFVRQLGSTSLLVYWVHTELVYGRWFGAFKESLTPWQCVATAAAVIALMVGLSTLRTRWKELRVLREKFAVWPFQPAPAPASGD